MAREGWHFNASGSNPVAGQAEANLVNANETDMLMRNSNTGAFEVYDISHNAITSAAPIGQVGFEWTVAGIAADPPAGIAAASTAQLVQTVASFGASAAVNSAPGGADTSQQTSLTMPCRREIGLAGAAVFRGVVDNSSGSDHCAGKHPLAKSMRAPL
jgi:hypothetical protein